MAQPPPQTQDVSTRSPLAGCTIVMIGICAMIFLVAFVIWNLFKLDKEIARFTSADAVAAPVPDLVAHTAAFNHYKAKLELFRTAVGNQESAQLRLTAEDINFAIAAEEKFKDLRKTFSIRSIENGKLHIQVSFPLRGKPMSGELRYLNGAMRAVPILSGDEIVLTVEHISSPGTEVTDVPEGFVGQMSPYRISQRYMDDEILGPWMARLSAVSIEGGEVVLAYDPAAASAPKDTSPFVKRALALFAVFLVFFLAVIIFLIAASRRRRAADDATRNHADP